VRENPDVIPKFPLGYSGHPRSHLIHDFSGSHESTSRTASRSVQLLSQSICNQLYKKVAPPGERPQFVFPYYKLQTKRLYMWSTCTSLADFSPDVTKSQLHQHPFNMSAVLLLLLLPSENVTHNTTITHWWPQGASFNASTLKEEAESLPQFLRAHSVTAFIYLPVLLYIAAISSLFSFSATWHVSVSRLCCVCL